MTFKDYLFKAQEQSIPMSRKLSKDTTRTVWMSKELLGALDHEKQAYRRGEK